MNQRQLKDLADRLGHLKSEIAVKTAEEKAIKDKLIAAGVTEVDGDLFRVTVSESSREVLDQAAVRAKLSGPFLRAHTTVTTFTRVNVVARIRDRAAA